MGNHINQSNRYQENRILDVDQLINRYEQYLHNSRGLAPGTIVDYCKHAKTFILSQSKKNNICVGSIRPEQVIRFILKYAQEKSAMCTQHMTSVLRSFFRFLILTQQIKEDLANIVPSVANRKKTSYPDVLSPEQIDMLLKSCDRNNALGMRNYAILILMASLGLRASEVCNLNLSDINWDGGKIVIRGKGSEMRLPIFNELGKALVAYLKHGRPNCESKKVFICSKRPLRGFTTSCIRRMLCSALKQAGLNPTRKGTHLLRHSFAMQLLEQGATLEQIDKNNIYLSEGRHGN